MAHHFNTDINLNQNIEGHEIVSIPVSLYKSIQGKYFVGQTKPLFVSDDKIAWAGLVNPCYSGVTLYTNVFTISNFSDDYIIAQIWLNSNFPENSYSSDMISATNTALCPPPHNEVFIKFKDTHVLLPTEGVNVYERIVPPNTTLVGEEDGKFITPPGGNYTIILKSSNCIANKVVVAFGWWEQK